jgi:hypothetical protein
MSVGTKQLRVAAVLAWVRENFEPGTAGPTSQQTAKHFGVGIKTAWRCMDTLRKSRVWQWDVPNHTNNGAKASQQMAEDCRNIRASWQRQLRAAVARYEMRRGDLGAINELAATLRDWRDVSGHSFCIVGGYRYRLPACGSNDVVRERLDSEPSEARTHWRG